MASTAYDCNVFECESKRKSKAKNIKLYKFPDKPGEENKRREWINFVKSTRPDGDDWEPQENSKVCSAHFVGGQKSIIEGSPAYIPTLFPGIYDFNPDDILEETQLNGVLLANRKAVRKLNSKLRLEGKQYYGERRTKDGVLLIPKEAREMGPPCTSPRCMQCKKSRFCRKFNEEDRKKIFNEYWSLTNLNERKNYIRKLIKIGVPKRRTTSKDNNTTRKMLRLADYKYYLRKNGKKYQVCKELFGNTFGMKNWKLYHWFKNDTKNLNSQIKNNDAGVESEFYTEDEGSSDMNETVEEITIKEEPLTDPLAYDSTSNHSYEDQQPSTSGIQVKTTSEVTNLILPVVKPDILPKNPTQNDSSLLASTIFLGTDKREWSQLIHTAVVAKNKRRKTHNEMVEPETMSHVEGQICVEMLCHDEENLEDDEHQNSNIEDFTQVREVYPVNPENINKCIHCPNIYPTQSALTEHYITIQFCTLCQTQVEDLYQHCLTTHVKDEKTCEFCSETIEIDIDNHMKLHSCLNEIICDNCNTKITSNEHICQITKNCISCNITFPTKQELLIHTISQHFKNDRCKRCFRNISIIGLGDLEMHVRYCKPKSKKYLEMCLKCHKEFVNIHKLMEHHKKEHECLVHCSEVFYRKNDLVDHLIENSHRIPGLVCKFCFIGFDDRQLYISHINKHKIKNNKYC